MMFATDVGRSFFSGLYQSRCGLQVLRCPSFAYTDSLEFPMRFYGSGATRLKPSQ